MDAILKKYAILLLFVSLSSCVIFEDDDKRTYFKTEGIGYVYYEDTKKPVQYAIIHVHYGFEGRPFGQVQPGTDSFRADENGYFRIKFLKRTQRSNVAGYNISARDSINSNDVYMRNHFIDISPSEIAGQNILNLDTLWIIR